ncbi:indole-3-glycerol phosphate synthase TrpC [Candidatus Poribacteria bacterium]|nr:indole-3-glycerol phosphate synthase TrpC [Candidatus Poribacteria bacterium]
MDFLDQIVKQKKNDIELKKNQNPLSELKKNIKETINIAKFKSAISVPNKINLIAEIKNASPSRGVLRTPFYPKEIANIYSACKVSAISVLTEMHYFKGNLEYLKEIQAITNIPLLMKDFIVDEYQIYEANIYGASAVLLIAAILDLNKLTHFLNLTNELGLDALVEVHDKEDMNKALSANAEIIGINNRNLKTFKVDLAASFELRKKILKNKIVVSESGIKNKDDIIRLKNAGFNAVLIGETFMQSPDIAAKINEIWE